MDCRYWQASKQYCSSSDFHFPKPQRLGFPGGTVVKNLLVRRRRRHGFYPWVGKIPWSRKRQPALVFLPGKFLGQRSQVGYSPWSCTELDMTEQLSMHARHLPTRKLAAAPEGMRQLWLLQGRTLLWPSQRRGCLGPAVLPLLINIHRSSSRCMFLPECTKLQMDLPAGAPWRALDWVWALGSQPQHGNSPTDRTWDGLFVPWDLGFLI